MVSSLVTVGGGMERVIDFESAHTTCQLKKGGRNYLVLGIFVAHISDTHGNEKQ